MHALHKISCKHCGKEFSDEAALRQHSEAKHAAAPGHGGGTAGRGGLGGIGALDGIGGGVKLPSMRIILALIVVVGLVAGIAWLAALPKAMRLPGYEDHWHAGFEARVCGVRQPDFAYSQGDVHTHGDGKIHVHPHSPDSLGANANLRKFFQSVNLGVANSTLQFPDARSFKDGDSCPDGRQGVVRVVINGQQRGDFLSYVPQDGDFVRVEFGQ